MALLAESLVDEWLNRQGFFTIRGIKHGVGEIDLLGVRFYEGIRSTKASSRWMAWEIFGIRQLSWDSRFDIV